MDMKVMNKISYGLYVLTARCGNQFNGCIINTLAQVTTSPNRVSVTVNKGNFTEYMIRSSGRFNVSMIDESADFSLFTHFGFQSGRWCNKFYDYVLKKAENGLPIQKADNNRVQGHMLIKETLAVKEVRDPHVKEVLTTDRLPMLMFFTSAGDKVFSDLESIQADDDNPNDCAKVPHELTHSVDALRYMVISRVMRSQLELPQPAADEDEAMDYDSVMMGGVITKSYMGV